MSSNKYDTKYPKDTDKKQQKILLLKKMINDIIIKTKKVIKHTIQEMRKDMIA
jgi:hypothetical protein